jgi:hypothetical protein
MSISFKVAVTSYLRAGKPAHGTRTEYLTTLRKWKDWGNGVPIEKLGRKEVREFLDWVYERAVTEEGINPGRTANKARAHLRAILSWAWDQELIQSLPHFPKPRDQRDVAGRHYLTKAEINALYFATHQMERPRGWHLPISVGKYWRCALVMFFNYGVDTGPAGKNRGCSRISERHARRTTMNTSPSRPSRSWDIRWAGLPIATTPTALPWRSRRS